MASASVHTAAELSVPMGGLLPGTHPMRYAKVRMVCIWRICFLCCCACTAIAQLCTRGGGVPGCAGMRGAASAFPREDKQFLRVTINFTISCGPFHVQLPPPPPLFKHSPRVWGGVRFCPGLPRRGWRTPGFPLDCGPVRACWWSFRGRWPVRAYRLTALRWFSLNDGESDRVNGGQAWISLDQVRYGPIGMDWIG